MNRPLLVFLLCLFFIISDSRQGFSQACTTGVYSGILNITGVSNTTISNLRILPSTKVPCIYLINCHNITITNCIIGPSADVGIRLDNCSNITISGNSFLSNEGGVYAVGCTGGIKVDNNQFANPQGGDNRGQFIQFNACSGAGNEIKDNVGESVPGVSNPEDLINIYLSNGTPASPIMISGNRFRGGGPSTHGGGILLGDSSGSYMVAQNNILVDPGQHGMGIPAGTNIKILNNQIYARQQSFSNVGIYMYNIYGTTCSNDTIQGNQVNYTKSDGTNNPFYFPTSPPGLACTSTLTTPNNGNATIDQSILPSRLLCPLLMANYKFNGNWGDSSGSQLTATPVNMSYVGQGKDLISANFNGSSAYLTIPRSGWLIPKTERITVSCWIKTSVGTGIQGIAQSQDADGYNNGWRMILNGTGFDIRMVTTNGTADVLCGAITPGTWNLLTMTYDGQHLNGYVNGALQTSTPLTGNIVYTTSTTSSMKIGSCNGTPYFSGFMDEFKFFDGNLLDSEILSDYNSTSASVLTPSAEMRSSLLFNQSWLDATGYHLDATNHGASFVCDGQSYAANFVGNSYLTLPQSTFLNPYSSTFSVGFWMKANSVSGIQSIAQAENSDGYNSGWRMLVNNGNFNGFLRTNQGFSDLYCGGAAVGVWQYYAMTYDGTNFKIYSNGNLAGSAALTGTVIYNSTSLAQIALCNGISNFNGHLDNFEFWDGVLTGAQILQRYNYFLPLFQTGQCSMIVSKDALTEFVPDATTASSFSIFPNPSSSMITIKTSKDLNSHVEFHVVHADIYSVTGQYLKSATGNNEQFDININDLKNGFYILKIKEAGKTEVKKFIVCH
jgi:parallel beta-helix repeat protein